MPSSVSLPVLIVAVVVAYIIGAKFPAIANKLPV